MFTEDAPPGPVHVGNTGGVDALTDSWERRFYRQLATELWATVDVTYWFHQDGVGAKRPTGPVVLLCEMGFRVVNGADPNNADVVPNEHEDDVFVTETVWVGAPTVDAVKQACAEFNPATLTWDGTWPVRETDEEA